MPVIDVHTHIFTKPWLELLKRKGGLYNIQQRPDGQHEVFRGDTSSHRRGTSTTIYASSTWTRPASTSQSCR